MSRRRGGTGNTEYPALSSASGGLRQPFEQDPLKAPDVPQYSRAFGELAQRGVSLSSPEKFWSKSHAQDAAVSGDASMTDAPAPTYLPPEVQQRKIDPQKWERMHPKTQMKEIMQIRHQKLVEARNLYANKREDFNALTEVEQSKIRKDTAEYVQKIKGVRQEINPDGARKALDKKIRANQRQQEEAELVAEFMGTLGVEVKIKGMTINNREKTNSVQNLNDQAQGSENLPDKYKGYDRKQWIADAKAWKESQDQKDTQGNDKPSRTADVEEEPEEGNS